MMNEAVHSLMDTLNQGFLFFGLVEAARPADQNYAFGHAQKKISLESVECHWAVFYRCRSWFGSCLAFLACL